MATISTKIGRLLEPRTQFLFTVAGALLASYAALNGLAVFTDTAYPALENVVGPAGFAFGFVGLLGLSQRLVDRSRWLVRGGAVCVALGAMGFTVIAVANLARFAGLLTEKPVWFPLLLGLVIVGMGPGFVAFGIASLRASDHPPTLGALLLAPPAIFGLMLAGAVTGLSPEWSSFAISAGQAVAYLAIGYVLRTGIPHQAGETPIADATTG